MSDDAIPSISSGAVGSRFVSQSDIDTAKARRDEQWKAAYARYISPPWPHQPTNSTPPLGLARNHPRSPRKTHSMAAALQRNWLPTG
ncbi:hypothetical protein FA95DRAFT_1554258 [Auriscalpium vulgare]|uniref:Uncharacterized protein n=1 Tax=Auriscalpium vulgare TaxID=40419 RepID=A0ACB8S6C9_9AGAM|nr:hypothetical protein FA95DRAFT_1554258 [Auriscalpium vulgare]